MDIPIYEKICEKCGRGFITTLHQNKVCFSCAMKSLIKFLGIVLITTLLYCSTSKAQVTVSQEFIDDATKAFTLVVEQRDAIAKLQGEVADLKRVVAEVERAKLTPCAVAQEKVKQDLVFWLSQKGDERELKKILKFTRKNGQRSIEAQCGINHKSVWSQVWDAAKVAAPVAAILIAR